MSIHDWSSRWFHHHGDEVRTDSADVESDHGASALGEALDRRDAEVTPLFGRRPGQRESESGVPGRSVARPSQRELDPEPDTGLNQDLAALSRVILNLPVESTDAQPAHVPGTRVSPDEDQSEPAPTPYARAGARARRDVPPLVGAPEPGDATVVGGKHAAPWTDESPEAVDTPATTGSDFDWPALDSLSIPEEAAAPSASPTPLAWGAPAIPFELEPEPEVDLEPLRWAEALDVDAPVAAPIEAAIESADDVFRWTAAEMELPLEVPLTATEPEPKPEPVALAQPEPDPTPAAAWDAMSVAPKVPAARPVQSSAALLRELSFLD